MNLLSPFDPGIRVSLLLLFSILLLLETAPADARCNSERCSREFERTRDELWTNLRPGQTLEDDATPVYCRAFQRFGRCLRGTQRSCRGHLVFQTNQVIVEKKSKKMSCARVLAEAGPSPSTPPTTRRPPLLQDSICSYHGDPEPAFCGLFGDPHVRTFSGEYQTCSVKGAWPLIDNTYLAVQVTNELAGSNEEGTAPTKLTVIVKRSESCTPQLTYEAQGDVLPSAFVDGAVSSGPSSGHSVSISVIAAGRHVEITLRHINATLVLRRIGGHLTFAARLPRGLADQAHERSALQLCARGCPKGERIDYRHVLAAGRPVSTVHAGRAATLTRETIAQMCREFEVTDYYFDACVFDVLFTGKTSFMESAREAQADLRRLMPQAVTELANRTQLLPSAAAPAAAAVWWVVMLAALLAVQR